MCARWNGGVRRGFGGRASYNGTATRGTDGTGVRAFPQAAPTVRTAVLALRSVSSQEDLALRHTRNITPALLTTGRRYAADASHASTAARPA